MKKKLLLFALLFSVCLCAMAQDIAMPANDVSNVNSVYALLAVIISSVLPFVLLLVKLIFDNKKNTDLAEYIRKHEEQHKADRENFKEAILTNEKRLDKTNEILQRLVDNDIEQEKRLARLEAQK
jgi:hypothetical protein